MHQATVIISTYNRQRRLIRQLVCLAAQEGDHIREVLVCDDGSSTDTRGALEPFFAQIPGLRLLRQPDQGFRAGQARNMGIETARGDLLVFIDDDVLLPATFVASHLAAHRTRNGASEKRVVLGFRYRTRTPVTRLPPTASQIVTSQLDDRIEQIGQRGEGLAGQPHPWFFVYSCNFSVPNEKMLFDESFVGWGIEDIELGYRLVREGYRVVVEPLANVLHFESNKPRDPFICEKRGLRPYYDSYVKNAVRFIAKYPEDHGLRRQLSQELRWYVPDETGSHWVKDGHEHDAEEVIRQVIRTIRASAPERHERASPDPRQASGLR